MKKIILCMLVGVWGCTNNYPNTGGSTLTEMEATERNHKRLVAATPPPQFDQSLERQNLVNRLKTLNVQNKVGYLYLLAMDGTVVAHFTIKGKVSSLNSLLTTPEQVVKMGDSASHFQPVVIPSPDFDGSYGKNPEGIFWFDTEGTYGEWSGHYLYFDRPLKITTPVRLQATVNLEK